LRFAARHITPPLGDSGRRRHASRFQRQPLFSPFSVITADFADCSCPLLMLSFSITPPFTPPPADATPEPRRRVC